jgi:predicted DNA-binding transcriptional regulator YafY
MTPQEKQLIDAICPAIQSGKLIRFWYKNVSGRQEWRIVEPYLIGQFPLKSIQLSAWLIPTEEQILAGQKEGWRSYILKNIGDLQILDDEFKKRQDFDPTGNGMKEIFCRPMMRS